MEHAPDSQKPKRNEIHEMGGTLGIIIVVALLALGGIYFLVMQQNKIHQNDQQLQDQAHS